MNPLDKLAQPKSYKEPVIVETKGKLGCYDVIVYKEPDANDFKKDQDGWASCYQAIFAKFKDVDSKKLKIPGQVSESSLALSCPESHRADDGTGSNKAFNTRLANEVLTTAYTFAGDNPNLNITLVANNAIIKEIYEELIEGSSKEGIYDKKILDRVILRDGHIEESTNDVIAITKEEVGDVKRASETYVKNKLKEAERELRPKRATTYQEPKEVESSWWEFGKSKVINRPESEIKPIKGKEAGSDIDKNDL